MRNRRALPLENTPPPPAAEGDDQTLANRVEVAPDAARTIEERGSLRVALVGVPNAGKSIVFQLLTGKQSTSTNYPYSTSRLEEAAVEIKGRAVTFIDTPGITGLEFCSEDEAPTREMLKQNPPDVIIQCMDASNLIRSLVLTAQLADLEIPLMICLNMVDEALGRGLFIDAGLLSSQLGIPVLPACPPDGRGIKRLLSEFSRASLLTPIEYPAWIQKKLAQQLPTITRAQQLETIMENTHPDRLPGQSVWHMILESHYHWAKLISDQITQQTGLEPKRSIWETLANVALHPWGAWVFLVGMIITVYFLVSRVGVGLLANGLEQYLVNPLITVIATTTGPGLAHEILVGQYGLLSMGVFNALCTVLPILSVFYFLFGFLEDIGYFPLLSVQFDRLLRSVGLTGKAVLPITLGFGCNSVATMTTRCLESPRQRFIACFMIALGIPCAVQLGVMVAILSTTPLHILLFLVLTVVLIQIIVGSVLARILPRHERGEFLMELPPLRKPRFSAILSRTYHRLVEFMSEALPLFVASAGLLLLLHFTGLLERIRDLLAPLVVSGLGMPRDFADMLLMTLARREVGAVMLKTAVDQGQLDLQQIFIGLLVMTLFVPCLSNTLMLGRVVGWWKTVVITISVIMISLGVGAVAKLLWI